MRNGIVTTCLIAAAASFSLMSPPAQADNQVSAPQRPDGMRTPVDQRIPAYDPAPPLEGDLYIGGGMVHSLLDQWVVIFKKAHPRVRVHLAAYGSTSAFGQLVEGVTKVVMLSRDFMPFELEFMQDKLGIEQPGVVVATGGYSTQTSACVPSQVILVNKDNPIKGLTLQQLDAIFSSTRNRGYKEDITRWGQLGLKGEWADKPINVYHPKMPDGVPNFFMLNILQGGKFKESNLSLYDHPGATRVDPYAIVLGNRGPGAKKSRVHGPEDRDPEAKTVALAETAAGPYFAGSFDDVRTRNYPLSRNIHLYLRRLPDEDVDPIAHEFVRVALSREGQYEVARTCFMPLPADAVEKSLLELQQANGD